MLLRRARTALADLDDAVLLHRYRSVRDQAALTELVTRHRYLVRARSRQYFLLGGDRDDVEQEGLIGLYKAIRDFQPSLEVSFRTFADLCVRRQVISAVKAANRLKHRPLNSYEPLVAPRSDDPDGGGEESMACVRAADPCEELVDTERARSLQHSVDALLSDLEASVLAMHLDGMSYEEMAVVLCRQTKSIDNALQRVRRKLGPHMEPAC